jgi:hypothetical protein
MQMRLRATSHNDLSAQANGALPGYVALRCATLERLVDQERAT